MGLPDVEEIVTGTPARDTFIPPDLWPANSPDLNPVDYRIWILERRLTASASVPVAGARH